MKVDLRGIALIASGLLEVDAVRQDLPLAFSDQNVRAEIAPAGRGFKLGKHGAGVKQAERLAREMGVGREVVRQVFFHVRRMERDPFEHTYEELGRERGGIAEQKQRPSPGNNAQRR